MGEKELTFIVPEEFQNGADSVVFQRIHFADFTVAAHSLGVVDGRIDDLVDGALERVEGGAVELGVQFVREGLYRRRGIGRCRIGVQRPEVNADFRRRRRRKSLEGAVEEDKPDLQIRGDIRGAVRLG